MSPKDEALFKFLYQFITDERKNRFEEVLAYRTRYLTVVLEDVFQPHNASAVLRSCELTGVQDVHIIENTNSYDINPDIVVGSSKWLNLKKYNAKSFNTPEAFEKLHQKGYKIVAACPHVNDFVPENLPIDAPIAIALGTEKLGLSDYAISNADLHVRIPMFGFTESYNISVSAALLLYALSKRLHESENINWHLLPEEMQVLRLEWTRHTLTNIHLYERKFEQLYADQSE